MHWIVTFVRMRLMFVLTLGTALFFCCFSTVSAENYSDLDDLLHGLGLDSDSTVQEATAIVGHLPQHEQEIIKSAILVVMRTWGGADPLTEQVPAHSVPSASSKVESDCCAEADELKETVGEQKKLIGDLKKAIETLRKGQGKVEK